MIIAIRLVLVGLMILTMNWIYTKTVYKKRATVLKWSILANLLGLFVSTFV